MKTNTIRDARKAAGVTQEQLAKLLGINRATLSRYESGDIDPPTSQIRRIASALNTSVHNLIPNDPGVLDPLLPPGLHGLDIKKETVDENTLCYMLDQMVDVEQINPGLYQRLKTVLYSLAISSGLEHVLVWYGDIYDDDDIDLSTPEAQAIIEKIRNDMQKAPQFKKLSDAAMQRMGVLQFNSEEDRIAYFYGLLNTDGKLAASKCFYQHLDKGHIGEVADYVEKLSEIPQYQRPAVPQMPQTPTEDGIPQDAPEEPQEPSGDK